MCGLPQRRTQGNGFEEIATLHPIVAEWKLIEDKGVKKLRRSFRFRNFQQAMDFSMAVGRIAEGEGHHPKLVTEWGRVTVDWWTHKIRGLHRNDFIMAAKTDHILQGNNFAMASIVSVEG